MMKIECPDCKYGGDVDDAKIPDDGIWGTCNKCKTRFFVKKETNVKPDAQDEFQILTTNPTVFCPKCGIEQPHTEKCSTCGIVFSEFISSRVKNEAQYKKYEASSLTPDKVVWWKQRRFAVLGIIVICIVSGVIVAQLNIIAESNRQKIIATNHEKIMMEERQKVQREERGRIQREESKRVQREEREKGENLLKANPLVYSDSQTGLMWAKNGNISGRIMNWYDAIQWVNNLNYAGYNDWRLPTKEELGDFGKRRGNYTTATEWYRNYGFSNLRSDVYWSSSSYADNKSQAWFGRIYGGDMNFDMKTDLCNVWPVRVGRL